MTAPAELRAAADRVDELARAATPGPWSPRPVRWMADHLSATIDTAAGGDGIGHHYPADATYIALLGPQVAPHLSSWLRTSAADAEQREAAGQDSAQSALIDAALAFAQAVNGTEVTP